MLGDYSRSRTRGRSHAVLGVVAALWLTRFLDSLLFGVAAIDVRTFTAMSAVRLGVALLASYIPAWRASSVDPMRSLRAEYRQFTRRSQQ